MYNRNDVISSKIGTYKIIITKAKVAKVMLKKWWSLNSYTKSWGTIM